MSIPESKYVKITSGVGGAAAVQQRDLITRIFTQNILAPVGQVLNFTSANEVQAHFGSQSEEYKRAVFYFGWVSKNITAPQLLSFYRWAPSAVAPQIIGKAPGLVSVFNTVTNGSLKITIGTVVKTITSLDFSTAVTLDDVASALTTAINAAAGVDGVMWSAATVIFNSALNAFVFTGGDTSTNDAISVSAPLAGDDISAASYLNWYAGTFSSGQSSSQTPDEALVASINVSTDFFSYLFMPVLSEVQMKTVAEVAATQDDLYLLLMPVAYDDTAAYAADLASVGGVALTLAPLASEYPEMVPGMIAAATNYNAPNSVQNYMYQQFNLTASVTDGTTAQTLDDRGINYYGQTQSNGQKISFYQDGVLTGAAVSTNITAMNVYANEAWLKSAAEAALLQLLLTLPKISANNFGRGQILAILQSVINLALANGVISVGSILSESQKLYITQISNDPNAWYQVQNNGYWVNVVIQTYVEASITKYKAVYTLIYKKDDVVSKIEGSHILI